VSAEANAAGGFLRRIIIAAMQDTEELGAQITGLREELAKVNAAAEQSTEALRACLVKVRVRMVSYALSYEKALSDRPLRCQWSCLQACLPTSKAEGRPRTHSLRDVLDAIFYVLKSGCHWRLLPYDFPPYSTVYYQDCPGGGPGYAYGHSYGLSLIIE
jgi:hypothetical protein